MKPGAAAQAATNPDQVKTTLRYHFLAVLLLSGVIYYLLESATEDEILDISRLLEMQEQDYDYFMLDVDSVHYTIAGSADYRFLARRVTHYPNPEYSLVEIPQFTIFGADNSTWRIDATRGRVELDTERNQERMVLDEAVTIRGTTAEGRPVSIFTDSLTLYPEEKSISTESVVLFESDGLTSSSRGLAADLGSNIIRQLADGRFEYDNPTP